MLNRQDMHIWMDNLTYNNGNVIHDLSDIIDYVIEYKFQGGPEQPIRYLEMRVNKNDIDAKYGDLKHNVVEGKTRLIIDAVDGGTFIITKIWLNNNEYDIVATGIEVTLNTATLSANDVTAINATNNDPPKIVQTIFDRWRQTLNLTGDANNSYAQDSDTYADDFVLYTSSSLTPNRTPPGYSIQFKENMPTLVALNMCALMDNAFIFFARKNGINTMYYVSYDDINPLAYNPGDVNKNGVVNIYPRMDSQYAEYTRFDMMMYKQLIGMSSKNSEGSETIVNNQIVSMENGKGESLSIESNRMYGDYAGVQVMSDMMISSDWTGHYSTYYNYTQFTATSNYVGYYVDYNNVKTLVTNANKNSLGIIAGITVAYIITNTSRIISDNLVRRYKDPTRSITVMLSEVKSDSDGSGWEESIQPFSYAKKIVDNVNNITITNAHLCDGETDNFMLRLSTFIRAYPDMTTEYTFGVMKETTLSQELANKLTGMSGTVADMRFNGDSIVNNGIITVESIINILYPVNSVYISYDSTNPADKFHVGTWTAIGQGTALISAGANYTAGSSYGANTKTITANNLPEHTHSLSDHSHSIGGGGSGKAYFGPFVVEGQSTGAYGVATDKEGIFNNNETQVTSYFPSGDSSNWSDDSVASSGSANKSRFISIYASPHNHGGSTGNAGGGNTGNNTTSNDDLNVMQLSIAVYMWKRTA